MKDALRRDVSLDAIAELRTEGFTVFRGFYEPSELEPIQIAIFELIRILARKHSARISHTEFSSATFDAGYQDLLRQDRRIVAELYDAMKCSPALVRWACSPRHDALFAKLRNTSLPGFSLGGYGLRIDNPNEEEFRAPWHQDYTFHQRSTDGVTFWVPLAPVPSESGPVEFCRGSHRDGVIPVTAGGTYGALIVDEQVRAAEYPRSNPETEVGDLIVIDYLTLHRSGRNRSNRPRWTLQARYFNFEEPDGIRGGWAGRKNTSIV